MEWEKYFENTILKRGADYFKKGKVIDFREDGSTCTATVLGSDEYMVTVEFDENGEVADMQCDCPYAESGEYCKHMAAVLYRKDNGEVETAHSKRKSNAAKKTCRIELETDIESFDDEKADIAALKNEIDWTIDSYKHRGFIDYRDAYDCAAEVSDIMTTNAELCIETWRYKEAFEYSFYVMKKFCSTDMDDSDGGTGLLCDYGIEIWERAIENAEAEKYAFDKLLKYKGTENAWYFKDLAEDFLLEHFDKQQFFAQKLKYVDKRIEETKKSGGYVEYKLGNYLKAKAIILKRMDLTGEAFEKFCADNWKYSEIQTYYIDEKIENGLYKEAEKLLQKCLESPTRGGVSSDYCRRKLMLVYKQIGDNAAYRKTLTDFVS
ncbi:MAG TPA: hypothetical protein DDY77_03285, partial [Clostridiales bacterium]|nr:hypothetical protein [Clostridiales bacterium]